MNRSVLVGVFAAGVATGVLATWAFMESPGSEVAHDLDATAPPPTSATTDTVTPHPSTTWAREQSAATPHVEPPPPAAPPPSSLAPPAADTTNQRVDLGPVLSRRLEAPTPPGFEDSLAVAHREFEQQPRDDSWAYSTEGDLQNSLVNEASMGAFIVEHVECRSTLCEVRLSGKPAQGEAIKTWSEGWNNPPFGKRLFINYSSMSVDGDRADAVYLFQRPDSRPPPR